MITVDHKIDESSIICTLSHTEVFDIVKTMLEIYNERYSKSYKFCILAINIEKVCESIMRFLLAHNSINVSDLDGIDNSLLNVWVRTNLSLISTNRYY